MKKWLKNFFIPHQGNEYKPNSLQKTAVVMMSLLVLITFAFTNLQALLWMNSSWLVSTVLPGVVVELTNDNRDKGALGQLSRNATLDRAAQLKAEHMAENSYFAHFAPDGTSPWHWFDEAGYNYMHAGENLAVHFTDSDEVVEAWMQSPTHRENILNGNYTEIGVGTAKGQYQGYPTVFVVQLFGTPAVPVGSLALDTPTAEETLALAESAPEPVSIPVSTPVPTAEQALEPVQETETVVALESDGEPVLLVSDVAEVSQEAVAGIEIAQPATLLDRPVSTIGRLATQPHALLNMVYTVTTLFVLMILMISIFVEVRKQHPVQIAYGTGLLATMAILTFVHASIAGGALIL